MLISLAPDAPIDRLRDRLTRAGLASRVLQGGRALLLDDPFVVTGVHDWLAAEPAVLAIEATHDLPLRALGRAGAPPAPRLDLGPLPLIVGPCAVENRSLAFEVAAFAASLGLRWLRGGSDKPRTSPHGFQGHGLAAAGWLREAADAHGLRCVSEITDVAEAPAYGELLDMVQVGARNMHNSRLLRRLGALGKPVLLKRGLSATPEEWLWAAEYLLDAGAPTVAFCERGARAPSPLKRFTLDLAAVPFIQSLTPFPVLVDPSHAAGHAPYVAPLARAAIAAGADGLVIECHPCPERSRSDALQALDFDALAVLVAELGRWLPQVAQKAGAACPD